MHVKFNLELNETSIYPNKEKTNPFFWINLD